MHEISDGFWSMAGRVFRFEDLVSYVARDMVQTPIGEHLRSAVDQALDGAWAVSGARP